MFLVIYLLLHFYYLLIWNMLKDYFVSLYREFALLKKNSHLTLVKMSKWLTICSFFYCTRSDERVCQMICSSIISVLSVTLSSSFIITAVNVNELLSIPIHEWVTESLIQMIRSETTQVTFFMSAHWISYSTISFQNIDSFRNHFKSLWVIKSLTPMGKCMYVFQNRQK